MNVAHWRVLVQVKHQLNNDFIGGSLALAVASALAGFLMRCVQALRVALHDRFFSTYDIPPGSPQYFAALRWLHNQPAVRRTSRRLVINPTAPPDAYNENGGANGSTTTSSAGSFNRNRARRSAPHDPDDPLELGFNTVPVLLRHQALCVRIGAALVWVGHGGSIGGDVGGMGGYEGGGGGMGGIGADGWGGMGMGAMGGGGGARGSWYQQLLSGTRGDAGLAGASAFGWDGIGGIGGGSGVGGGAIRLRIMGRDGEGTVRKILEQGHRLGRGTARRFTQVYLPSTAMAPMSRGGGMGGGMGGGGGGGWIRPEWVDAGRKPARPISSVILRGSDAVDILEDARAFLRLVSE